MSSPRSSDSVSYSEYETPLSSESAGGSEASSCADDVVQFAGLTKAIPSTPVGRPLEGLSELFSANISAKIYRTATGALQKDTSAGGSVTRPTGYPEIVPQNGSTAGCYEYREADFWTCGFFPGDPICTAGARHEVSSGNPRAERGGLPCISPRPENLRNHLAVMAKIWSEPLHAMADRTDTHDIGFIIMPALQRAWELSSDTRSLASIITAAHKLS